MIDRSDAPAIDALVACPATFWVSPSPGRWHLVVASAATQLPPDFAVREFVGDHVYIDRTVRQGLNGAGEITRRQTLRRNGKYIAGGERYGDGAVGCGRAGWLCATADGCYGPAGGRGQSEIQAGGMCHAHERGESQRDVQRLLIGRHGCRNLSRQRGHLQAKEISGGLRDDGTGKRRGRGGDTQVWDRPP